MTAMPKQSPVARYVAVLVLLTGIPGLGAAASAQARGFDVREHYDKAEHMVPMRDGVKLFTIVYTPRDTAQTYPVLLYRTPYSIRPYGPDEYRALLGPSAEFDEDGYIFAFQDVRGKFKSEGAFEVIRPLYRDAGASMSPPLL